MTYFLIGVGVGAVLMLVFVLRCGIGVVHHRHRIGHVIQYMEHRKITLLGEDKQKIEAQLSEN